MTEPVASSSGSSKHLVVGVGSAIVVLFILVPLLISTLYMPGQGKPSNQEAVLTADAKTKDSSNITGTLKLINQVNMDTSNWKTDWVTFQTSYKYTVSANISFPEEFTEEKTTDAYNHVTKIVFTLNPNDDDNISVYATATNIKGDGLKTFPGKLTNGVIFTRSELGNGFIQYWLKNPKNNTQQLGVSLNFDTKTPNYERDDWNNILSGIVNLVNFK